MVLTKKDHQRFKLDENVLLVNLEVAFGFSEVARKVVRSAEKRAFALESQFEGVDPQAQTDEIHKQFKILLEKLDTFSNVGEAS